MTQTTETRVGLFRLKVQWFSATLHMCVCVAETKRPTKQQQLKNSSKNKSEERTQVFHNRLGANKTCVCISRPSLTNEIPKSADSGLT